MCGLQSLPLAGAGILPCLGQVYPKSMSVLSTIILELADGLNFRGRTTRSRFWAFAPFGLMLPVVTFPLSKKYFNVDYPSIGVLMLTFAAFLPLLASGARRLQDTGEAGQGVFLPFTPIAYFFASMMIWELGFDALLGGIPVLIAYLLVALYWLSFPFVLLASVLWIGPLAGQLILPSEPGTNKYGPNPHEALK